MEDTGEGKDMKIYELSYLLVPSIAEELVGSQVESINTAVREKVAIFISEEAPRLIDLAYPMVHTVGNKKLKFDSAYFGWVKFELEPGSVEELKHVFARDEQIVRTLLVKTVRENTYLAKRMTAKLDAKRRVSKEAGEAKNPHRPKKLTAKLTALSLNKQYHTIRVCI